MAQQLDLRPGPDRTTAAPATRQRWWPGLGWLVAVVLLLAVGLIGWRLIGGTRTANRGPAPQTVGVATVATGDIDVVMTGLGAVTPIATVTVQTQIDGQLQVLAFREGQIVHKGDFLAQIDPRPYQVALELAQGSLAHDTALLAQARADYARYQTLGRQDSISRQQVQDQLFLIKQDEGLIVTDNANIDSAKLNLVYCHIVSPVDGRIGIRLVDQGNYVQTSDTTGIVVITQLQPMSVLFTLPEIDVAPIARQMKSATLTVTAYDATNTEQIAAGTLATMDNEIDNTTGTVKLRALFPNTDEALFPQQFVNAHLLVQTLHGVVVAPVAAVQQGAPGSFVYLVKPGDTVAVQVVKTGVTQGDRIQITDGLKAGDQVVTDGVDRLRDGARIAIAPTPIAPSAGGPAPAPTAPVRGRTARGEKGASGE